MKLTREQIAINAYLKLLQSKSAPAGALYKRSSFLDKLAPHLRSKALIGTDFSQALEATIEYMSSDDKEECLNFAREFYPFWMQDIKAIAKFNSSYHFDFASIRWKPLPSTLTGLTKSIEKAQFDENESKSLNTYVQTMLENGAGEAVVDTRSKLAKMILIRLRDAPVKNSKTYRMAIDMILPLFTIDEIKQLFLTVVTEFYFHWNEYS